METTLKTKVSEIFSRYHFSPEDAKFISDVLDEIDERQEQKFLASKELFLTQPDKVEIIDRINDVKTELNNKIGDVEMNLNNKISDVRTDLNNRSGDMETKLNNRISMVEHRLSKQMYIIGLVQFLAIVTSIVGILSFILK